jgi:hypothetical protein
VILGGTRGTRHSDVGGKILWKYLVPRGKQRTFDRSTSASAVHSRGCDDVKYLLLAIGWCVRKVLYRGVISSRGAFFILRVRIPVLDLSPGVFSEIPLNNVSPSHLIFRIHRIHPIASENIQSDSIDQKIVVLTLYYEVSRRYDSLLLIAGGCAGRANTPRQ